MGTTPAPMPTVPMYAPDGTLGDVPYDKMHDALQAGAKLGVNVLAPDGTKGVVPADRLAEANKAGGKTIPWNLSDADGDKSGQGFWSHVHQSIHQMIPSEVPSVSDMAKTGAKAALGPLPGAVEGGVNAAKEYYAARQRGHDIPYSADAAASTLVGVNPERMEAAANAGDTAGVLGETAVPTALAVAPLAAEGAGRALAPVTSAARAGAKEALFTPEGKPTPLAKAITHPVDAATDYALRKAVGAPDVPVKGTAVPIRQSPNFDPAAYKAGVAERTTQPPEASPIATSDTPAPAAAASEGRPATWTNARVQELAGQGNRDAIQQAVLRGMKLPENARYVAGDANFSGVTSNPRSVTVFAPDGTPIQQGAPLGLEDLKNSVAKQPTTAYRVRNQGEEGLPIGGSKNSAAHATTTLEDAQRLAPGRESVTGEPQEIVRYDLSKLKEGTDYVRVPRPGQPDWIRMLRPLKESEVQTVKPQ